MTSSFLQPGAACKRSRLPGWLRLLITFAALFALKYLLPMVGIGAVLQVLILLIAITVFAYLFWWNCTPDRRGVAILLGIVWIAGLIKIVRLL